MSIDATDAADESDVEPTPQADEPLGAIPGYQLLRVVGRGGNNIVYEARQDGLNRIVAIKIIRSGNPRELLRLRAQADAVSSVCHPNVVQIYDATEHEGKSILTLEFVSGGTLANHLRDVGRMTAKSAALLLIGVARGIAAAHAQQIVHGDLKPANILLDQAEEPKVANLGSTYQRTGSAVAVGNPAYVAPELITGTTKFVGPTADVWAMGVILYECITGRRPFPAESVTELVNAICNASPELPTQLVPDLPSDLESVCLKCLKKSPTERYPSATELADDLTRFLGGEPVNARDVGLGERFVKWVRGHNVAATFLAGMLTLTVVGLVGFYLMWQKAQTHFAAAKESEMMEQHRAAEAEMARARAEQVQMTERKRADEATTGHRTADQTLQELAGHAADLISLVSAQNPQLPADAASRQVMLDSLAACRRAAASPQTTFSMRVRLSAAFVTTGNRFEKQGLHAEATELYREAVEVIRPAVTENPNDLQAAAQFTTSLAHRAAMLTRHGKATEALPLLLEAEKLDRLGMSAAEPGERPFWRGNLFLHLEALADVYRALGRRQEAKRTLQDAKGRVQSVDQLRLIAGDFALLAASVPNPPNAEEAKEKEEYLTEAIETLRAAVEGGWRFPSAQVSKPSLIDNADFGPFKDNPEVKKLLAEAAKK
ncbi:MAG: serine/threonine protein kinase [Planctomycetes bacterium]|nr:serine/threonine protein kinase [Planctomycetota bacterium]